MKNLSKSVFVALAMVCVVACGDDDDDKGDDDGQTSGPGLRDGGALDGGFGPSAEGDEGWLCAKQSECNEPLKCVGSIFTVGVCGRPCSKSSPCEDADEVCYSYTGNDADLHCVNQVTEEYALCGVYDTSICKDRSCLYEPDRPFGVCVDICSLEGEVTPSDAGVDDGGLIVAPPAGFAMCRADEMCIDGVLARPENSEGVCGTEVDRGEACSPLTGLHCKLGDVCTPDVPSDQNSDWSCHQDCSAGNDCDKGRCTIIQNLVAYCL
jgi:hypothetical protein